MENLNMIDGQLLPQIGFGTYKLNGAQGVHAIVNALNQGYRILDTAYNYENEGTVGKAIERSHVSRDQIIVTSKLPGRYQDYDAALTAIQESIYRLNVDYIDLYLLHWKSQYPLEETISAFEEAKNLGKIKEWGVSNFDTSDMKHLLSLPNGHECVANQVRYNIGDRGIEYDLKPFMRENNIALISYAPIARGDKLGKNLTKSPVLLELSRKYEVDVFQILLAWNIRDGHTLAIPKSSNKLHIENNMGASNIHLTEEDIQKIDSEYPPPTTKEPLALY